MKLIPTIGLNYKTQIVSWIQIYKENNMYAKTNPIFFMF